MTRSFGSFQSCPIDLCKKLGICRMIDGPNVEFVNTALSHCRQKLFGHHFAITLRAQTIGVQSANFDRPVQGRYLQVEVLSEVSGEAWASAADIGWRCSLCFIGSDGPATGGSCGISRRGGASLLPDAARCAFA